MSTKPINQTRSKDLHSLMIIRMNRNGILPTVALLCLPCESLARGSLHIDPTFHIAVALISLYFVLQFWLLIFSIPFFVMLFASKVVGLNINDNLLSFSGSGFWYSYGFVFVPLMLAKRDFSTFELIVITTIVQLLTWFGIAAAMQLAENRWNRRFR